MTEVRYVHNKRNEDLIYQNCVGKFSVHRKIFMQKYKNQG